MVKTTLVIGTGYATACITSKRRSVTYGKGYVVRCADGSFEDRDRLIQERGSKGDEPIVAAYVNGSLIDRRDWS